MEPIPLRALLGNSIDPALCKLHCAVFDGTDHPINVLSTSWDEWVGWNEWRSSSRDEFNRQFIFSMAQEIAEPTLWLFGGVFEVLGRSAVTQARSYEIQLRPDLMGLYVKRLRIRFHRPSRTVRLNMDKQLDQMTVHSVLAEPYAGSPFPGHDQINHTLGELQVVIRQDRPDWRIALQHMKGVYVVHDLKTGEPYVGSASGDTGIWHRLGDYARTLHGGNAGLIDLVAREGEEYARQNLRFALLEFWSMRTEDKHVIARENYWKDVLISKSLGNNRN